MGVIRAMLQSMCTLTAVALASVVSAQDADSKPALPTPAIPAILDAFRSHSIVALCDAHGNEQAQAFLKALVRHPGFPGVVNDIVVEFGNARYQDVVDRFIRGEGLAIEALRAAWQNTTVANEIPVDEEFFQVVRTVNATLPRERQIRVLLGDPPIDWTVVRDRADHFKWLAMRDSYPAAVVQLEVLAKERRALLVYGQLHFQRKNIYSNLDMQDWRRQTIVSLLESAGPTKLFSIWRVGDNAARVQPEVASWNAPSLAVIRGTALGAADITTFSPTPARFAFRGDSRESIPRDRWATSARRSSSTPRCTSGRIQRCRRCSYPLESVRMPAISRNDCAESRSREFRSMRLSAFENSVRNEHAAV